jgi:hypothetical protein
MSNPRQIAKYQTNKYLLEVIDNLRIAETENASRIHHKYSRLKLIALDYSKGTGNQTISADANIDAVTVKYIAEIMLNGAIMPPGKQIKIYSEQKILSHALNDNGMAKVTIFTIMYDSGRNYCWQITVENGSGKPQKQPSGGIAVEKGSYKKGNQIQVYMNDIDFKKYFLTVRDYVLAWETVHLRSLLQDRARYEEQNNTRVPVNN